MRLEGKIAVVSGGASGIGAACVSRFLAEGAQVVSLDIAKTEVQGAYDLQVDLQDADEIRGAHARVRKDIGEASIVVHAAAATAFASTLDTTAEDLDRVLKTNVGGTYGLVQAFAPAMQTAKDGSIVILSSITGLVGAPGLSAYTASKGALITLTRTLALELAPWQIRVNCVCPASIDTPLLRASFEHTNDPEQARQLNIKRHPLGRLGTPEDVANLVLFLASDEARWITGGTYVIDGGASIARRWQE